MHIYMCINFCVGVLYAYGLVSTPLCVYHVYISVFVCVFTCLLVSIVLCVGACMLCLIHVHMGDL